MRRIYFCYLMVVLPNARPLHCGLSLENYYPSLSQGLEDWFDLFTCLKFLLYISASKYYSCQLLRCMHLIFFFWLVHEPVELSLPHHKWRGCPLCIHLLVSFKLLYQSSHWYCRWNSQIRKITDMHLSQLNLFVKRYFGLIASLFQLKKLFIE